MNSKEKTYAINRLHNIKRELINKKKDSIKLKWNYDFSFGAVDINNINKVAYLTNRDLFSEMDKTQLVPISQETFVKLMNNPSFSGYFYPYEVFVNYLEIEQKVKEEFLNKYIIMQKYIEKIESKIQEFEDSIMLDTSCKDFLEMLNILKKIK